MLGRTVQVGSITDSNNEIATLEIDGDGKY